MIIRRAPFPVVVAPAVEARIDALLAGEAARWGLVDPELIPPIEALRRFVLDGTAARVSGKVVRFQGAYAADNEPLAARICVPVAVTVTTAPVPSPPYVALCAEPMSTRLNPAVNVVSKASFFICTSP
jgi:hypothetical protein